MSKTRKILTTLTMAVFTTTASLTAISSVQAHPTGEVHAHRLLTPPSWTPPPGVFTPVPTPTPPAPPPHRHGGLRRGEAAALGLLGGVIIGSALANANRRTVQSVVLPPEHYVWCDNRYRSYVIATNTFTGYDGKQRYCISPYVR